MSRGLVRNLGVFAAYDCPVADRCARQGCSNNAYVISSHVHQLGALLATVFKKGLGSVTSPTNSSEP
jgi:hypothetical protein